jgi:hypothetical protein
MTGNRSTDDRAQAFTMEGFIGGLLILAAVLFALQATIFTPTASGSTSEETQLTLQRQAEDVLVTTAARESNGLSYYVRYWDVERYTFVGAKNPTVGYGPEGVPGALGDRLAAVFEQRGHSYNLVFAYETRGKRAPETIPLVYRGNPPSSAVVATYTFTLYDTQTLTGPDATHAELTDYDTNASDGDDGYYPIPDIAPNSTVYNVVEVRLVVW